MKEIIRIETISQVHEALGLGAPRHPLVSLIPIEELSSYDYGDASYIMEIFQVSLKMGITGSILYGRNSYDFQEGTMVFSRPGQALQYTDNEGTGEGSGWTLLFHPDIIRKSELGRTIDQYSFFSYEANEALHVSEKERESLSELVEKIEHEYMLNIDRHSQDLIVANIHLLLKYCKRYYDRQFYTRTNLNKDHLARFEELLKAYYQSGKPLDLGVPSVKYCASELHMSSHYLSDLLKKETGKNAQENIQLFLIDRAKTLLLSSEESISQVAYELGFEYPQHFSKLFKSKTGMSPAAYRNSN